MMNLVSILLSFFLESKARQHAENLREAGAKAADKGRRLAIAGLFVLIAVIFFFSGILVAVLEMGHQIDKQEFLNYSGMMISATVLVGFGVLGLIAAYFAGQEPELPPPPPPPPRSQVVELVESIVLTFLKDFQTRNTSKDHTGHHQS